MQPFYTIITVCYNAEDTILKTIESVLHQDFDNFEYIVIDGKSKDSTLNIIKQFEPLFKGRLKYISESDNGIYSAMNKGILMGSGDWYFFLNSDDTFYNSNVLKEIAIEILKVSEKSIVYGDYISQHNDMEEIIKQKVKINSKYWLQCMLCHQSMFFNKSVFKRVGLYDCRYKIASDYDILIKAFIASKRSFFYTPMIISRYIRGGFSDINQSLMIEERKSIVKELYSKHFPLYYKYLSSRKTIKRIISRFVFKK